MQVSIEDTLYFGASRAHGRVTSHEWQTFVDSEITPRFPQGLTHWQASGQWADNRGKTIKEMAFVLKLVHPDTEKDEQSIDEITNIYRQHYDQDSVLRVRNQVCVSF